MDAVDRGKPSVRGSRVRASRLLLACSFVLALATSAAPAFAGQASVGEPLFYPCSTCHPVRPGGGTTLAGRPLPNGFKGHGIVLESHDILGAGSEACAACHDDPAKDPGKLKLVDGTFVDITGDVSGVCRRCHSAKYDAWKAGTHGRHEPKCTAAGCHDPHSPGFNFAGALTPFVGTGFQTHLLPERVPFKPFFSPPIPPPVTTPGWLVAVSVLGLVAVGGIAGALVKGRSKR